MPTRNPDSNPDIRTRLASARGQLRRRESIRAAATAAGIAGGAVVLLWGIDALYALPEAVAGWLVLATLLTAASVLGVGLLRALFRQPSQAELAERIERAHPELMNALTCAVEQSARQAGARGLFGDAVIEEATRASAPLDFLAAVLPGRLRGRRLAMLCAAAAVFLALGANSRPARKAWVWCRGVPGVRVAPGTVDVPEHEDLTVSATVRRWEDVADIEFVDSGGRHRFAMNAEGERHTFTFYDLVAPIRYRVRTPSVASPWHTLSVYAPPKIDSVAVRTTPPAYTGLSESTSDQLANASVVEGSEVSTTLQTRTGIRAFWVEDGQEVAFRQERIEQHTRHQRSLRAEASRSYRIRLRDEDGHSADHGPFRLEVIPDQPPTADVLAPQEDGAVPPDQPFDATALAADDFGVSSVDVQLTVSGTRQETFTLHKASGAPSEAPAETTVGKRISPEQLGLETGDIVTLVFVARDNRQPVPQAAQSIVVFVEIREDAPPQEQQQQGGAGEKKELDIARLLAESKRLIRLSYDLGAAWRTPKEEDVAALAGSLKDLSNEILRMSDEVKKLAAQQGMEGEIPHLARASEALQAAENRVRDRLIRDSVPPQEQALSWLVRLAQELRKNSQSSGSGESGQGQPKQKQDPSDSGEQGQQRRALGERLEALREYMASVSELAERQADLNEELEASRRLSLSEEERRELAARQAEIGEDAGELGNELASAELGEPARSVGAARQAMKRGERNARNGSVGAAARDGTRAHTRLLAAEEQLRDAMRYAAGAEMNALAALAGHLAEKEKQEAGTSQEFAKSAPGQKAVDDARERQKRIREGAEQLVEAMEQTAAGLHETFPRAGETLGKAAQQARKEDLSRTMKRAENALLYEQFDTAANSQTEAARRLQRVGDRIREGAGQLPRVGRSEILDALRRIRSAEEGMRAVGQTGNQGKEAGRRVERTRGQMEALLKRLGRDLGEPGLGNLGLLLGSPAENSSPAEAAAYASDILQRAAAIVQRHVLRDDIRRAYRISKRATEVPAQYREAVEEYFRRLSEGE